MTDVEQSASLCGKQERERELRGASGGGGERVFPVSFLLERCNSHLYLKLPSTLPASSPAGNPYPATLPSLTGRTRLLSAEHSSLTALQTLRRPPAAAGAGGM